MQKRYRLKADHPVAKKVDQIFALMEKLKVQFIAPTGNVAEATVCVDGVTYELVDIEEGYSNQVRELPPSTEYKIVFSKTENE